MSFQKYEEQLESIARFPEREAQNAQAIVRQMPEASMVLDRESWAALGIEVSDGRVPVKVRAPELREDPDTGRSVIRFAQKDVYDVSQTSAPDMRRAAPAPEEVYAAILAQADCPVREGRVPYGEIGIWDPRKNQIVLRSGLEGEKKAVALIQQIGRSRAQMPGEHALKEIRELRADAFTRAVARHYDIDAVKYLGNTAAKNASRISGWQGTIAPAHVEARVMIRRTDAALEHSRSIDQTHGAAQKPVHTNTNTRKTERPREAALSR